MDLYDKNIIYNEKSYSFLLLQWSISNAIKTENKKIKVK